MKTDFEAGSFEGAVLERLDDLRGDVQDLKGAVARIHDRCLEEAEVVSAADARGKLHTWLLGAIGGALAALASWMVMHVHGTHP